MSEKFDLDNELLAQMRQDFLTESQEILDRLGVELARLDRGAHPELINTIFREVHTLKGTAGFVNLATLQRLAHRMEDVFGEVRAEKLAVTPQLVDAAFQCLDRLIALRRDVANGHFGESDVAAQVKLLDSLLDKNSGGSSPNLTASAVSQALKALEPPPGVSGLAAAETTLRVEIDTLDTLLNLAGELITARNSLTATAERLADPNLHDDTLAINRLTRQMQSAISSLRLVPIERLLNRFTPIVRGVARDLGKEVRYVIKGGETPLDRTVSEQISDPLVHMIRNAIDHGLETPEVRRRAGKPEEGTLTISAERHGDDVVVRVADDGTGIDPDQLRHTAVSRGLFSEAQAQDLTDEEATRLIFSPGFSTTTAVTDLSGRGVGMDVVLQNVKRLRGRIEIESQAGLGTTFVITLPLTLSILQVLLVRSGGYTYAVPLRNIKETLMLTEGAVQHLQHRAVTYVRESPLPVHVLAQWLEPQTGQADIRETKPAFVTRLARGDEVVVVDELVGKQQMVVKPLSPYLGHVAGVEGTAILPDGQVGLILDLEQLLVDAGED